jgi:hypothetical protein
MTKTPIAALTGYEPTTSVVRIEPEDRLDGSNFKLWKIFIHDLLERYGLEQFLQETKDNPAKLTKEKEARRIITASLDSTHKLAHVTSDIKPWTLYKNLCDLYEPLLKITKSSIEEEIKTTTVSAGDDILQFHLKLSNLRLRLIEAGGSMSEVEYRQLFLDKFRPIYTNQVEIAEAMNSKTIHDIIGSFVKKQGHLKTEQELERQLAMKANQQFKNSKNQDRKQLFCFNCGKQGHTKENCRQDKASSEELEKIKKAYFGDKYKPPHRRQNQATKQHQKSMPNKDTQPMWTVSQGNLGDLLIYATRYKQFSISWTLTSW